MHARERNRKKVVTLVNFCGKSRWHATRSNELERRGERERRGKREREKERERENGR